jgi:hypothetical protein
MNLNPQIGSYQYDLANNLKVGSSSSVDPYTGLGANGNNASGYNSQFQGVIPQTVSINPVSPTGQPVSITGDSLQKSNSVTVPQPQGNANNAAQAIIGGSTAQQNAAQTQLTDYQKQIDQNAETARKQAEIAAKNPALTQALGVSGNKAGLTAQEEAKAPNLEASKELARNLTQEYQTKELAYNQILKSIFEAPGLTQGQKQAQLEQIGKTHAYDMTDLSIRQNIAAGNYQALQDSVDKRINLLYGDAKDQVDYYTQIKNNADLNFTRAEERVLDQKKADAERQVQKGDEIKKTINTLLLSASTQNAPKDVIERISKATNEGEAIQAAGQYGTDQLDRQYKQAQINNIYQNIAESKAKMLADSQKGSFDVSSIKGLDIPSAEKNALSLTAIINHSKLDAGAKTKLADILGVVNASQGLANANPDGSFGGINPLNTILDAKIPFTNIGIPFREAGRSAQGTLNIGYLNAINLKVQQWASGASLTNQQLEQVNKFTPAPNDTDASVKLKLNNLANFMNTQAKSILQSQGIEFIPEKVDFFKQANDLAKQSNSEFLNNFGSSNSPQVDNASFFNQ